MEAAVLGVVGGSGGVGASTFAAVLAYAADGMLVDLDGTGGGIDVLLGVERVAGARWSQLRLDGGRLDPDALVRGLPRWGPVPVLAADAGSPPAVQVGQVIDAATEQGPVVLDLPRGPCPTREAALAQCALVIVVASATVRGIAAARAVVDGLTGVPVGLVVRRAAVRPQELGRLVGAPVLGSMAGRLLPADRALSADNLPARLVRLADGVLDGVVDRGRVTA